MTSYKSLWDLSRSALLQLYPENKKSIIPNDLLIFTARFLCRIEKITTITTDYVGYVIILTDIDMVSVKNGIATELY